jgi:hypothetical protein
MKSKQIEWDAVTLRGDISGERKFCIWDYPFSTSYLVDTNLSISKEADIELTGTIYKSVEEAKQSCQDHLQQHVDGVIIATTAINYRRLI